MENANTTDEQMIPSQSPKRTECAIDAKLSAITRSNRVSFILLFAFPIQLESSSRDGIRNCFALN